MCSICRQGIYATYRRNVDGLLTLMGSLSDESLSPSTNPDGHSVVHVNLKCPSGVMQPITLKYSCNVLSVVLFKEVEKIIGVPTSLQVLTYGMHFCDQMSHSTIINCRMDVSSISQLGVLVVQDLIQVSPSELV